MNFSKTKDSFRIDTIVVLSVFLIITLIILPVIFLLI